MTIWTNIAQFLKCWIMIFSDVIGEVKIAVTVWKIWLFWLFPKIPLWSWPNILNIEPWIFIILILIHNQPDTMYSEFAKREFMRRIENPKKTKRVSWIFRLLNFNLFHSHEEVDNQHDNEQCDNHTSIHKIFIFAKSPLDESHCVIGEAQSWADRHHFVTCALEQFPLISQTF